MSHVRVVDIARGEGLNAAEVNHQIEFVQIAVHQTVFRGQSGEHGHGLFVNALGLLDRKLIGINLIQGQASNEVHAHHVSIVRQGRRRRITHIVQRLHKGKFLHGRGPRQKEPTAAVRRAVIALLLHVAKRRATQPVKFEHDLFADAIDGQVDIGFLTRANFGSQRGNERRCFGQADMTLLVVAVAVAVATPIFLFLERVECQNVVSGRGDAVTIVAARFAFVTEQLVAQQAADNFVATAVSQFRQVGNER
mmetsp:Transcript_22513/g.49045  ORF Transcript_22513/g.49045 Transcript_22513/m.49045 type:complete len:251 (-) Transcript_22513:206-958(-)